MTSVTIEGLGRKWAWPAIDTKCRKVIFDMAADLEAVYRHCRAFDFAIQAGGNMGVWPWLLAKKFKLVATFEPDPECFALMAQNLRGVPNVTGLKRALTDRPQMFAMANETPANRGAQWTRPDPRGAIKGIPLDSLSPKGCDLLCLDIEGAELKALQGAAETIGQYRPTIVIEDKGLSERFGVKQGAAETWLNEAFSYTVAARIHRDVILTCA